MGIHNNLLRLWMRSTVHDQREAIQDYPTQSPPQRQTDNDSVFDWCMDGLDDWNFSWESANDFSLVDLECLLPRFRLPDLVSSNSHEWKRHYSFLCSLWIVLLMYSCLDSMFEECIPGCRTAWLRLPTTFLSIMVFIFQNLKFLENKIGNWQFTFCQRLFWTYELGIVDFHGKIRCSYFMEIVEKPQYLLKRSVSCDDS